MKSLKINKKISLFIFLTTIFFPGIYSDLVFLISNQYLLFIDYLNFLGNLKEQHFLNLNSSLYADLKELLINRKSIYYQSLTILNIIVGVFHGFKFLNHNNEFKQQIKALFFPYNKNIFCEFPNTKFDKEFKNIEYSNNICGLNSEFDSVVYKYEKIKQFLQNSEKNTFNKILFLDLQHLIIDSEKIKTINPKDYKSIQDNIKNRITQIDDLFNKKIEENTQNIESKLKVLKYFLQDKSY